MGLGPLGQITMDPSDGDGGESDDAPEVDHSHVEIGEQGPVHGSVSSHGPTDGKCHPYRRSRPAT